MDKKILLLLCLLPVSFLIGKYTATPQVKTVVKTEIKEVVKENRHVDTIKVTKPDGTIIEKIVDRTVVEKKAEVKQLQSITPNKNNVLSLSVTPLDFSFSSVNLKYNLDYQSNNLIGPFGVTTGISTSRQGLEARIGLTNKN